ncbi:MAG TPA: hypothetical protein VGH06_02115 [Candidatus Udaeobacter sp.]|jgi:hypothetical protein
MAFVARQCVIAFVFGSLLFCTSCEKHPLGQMPDVQREQPDPAKEWSQAHKMSSEEPAESHLHEAR